MKRSLLFILFLTFLSLAVVACRSTITTVPPSLPTETATALPPTAIPTDTSIPATSTATPTATPLPQAEHQIGVRVVNGEGEFYDRNTKMRFVPRGNNLIRLAWQVGVNGERFFYHSTFNVGLYDPERIERTLQAMHDEGYNVVRVFLSGSCRDECLGEPAGGLSQAYVANLADFLQKAKQNSIYVLLTSDSLPAMGGYIQLLDTTWSEDFAGNSATFLREGGILAETKLYRDLISGLVNQGAPLDAILAYELSNELFFEANFPPLSLTTGVVSTANGKTYDMASEEDKQHMMDEGLVYYIDTMRAAILEVDPTALVTVGFFVPHGPNPTRQGDPRVINTAPAIWDSQADFIDLHPYPGVELNLAQYDENFQINGMKEKPILMGEFGGFKFSYSAASVAAKALQDWQVASCQEGYDGWLLWTWDSDEQEELWNGLSQGSEINRALSPKERPDPCLPGEAAVVNVALGKPVKASRSLPSNPPEIAVDGAYANWWGAGAFPPQWIQIDLEAPTTITQVRLTTSQSPSGNTVHRLLGKGPGEAYRVLHTFRGYTSDNQALEFTPETPWEGIQYLLIETTSSPSWVSWREIEVFSPAESGGGN